MKLSIAVLSSVLLSGVLVSSLQAAPADKAGGSKNLISPAKDTIHIAPTSAIKPGAANAIRRNALPGVNPLPGGARGGCPDLAVTSLQPRWAVRNSNGSYSFKLVAVIENVGATNYISASNQQGVIMEEGHSQLAFNPLLDRSANIDYAPGEKGSSIASVTNWFPNSEFAVDFSATLSFDPDLYIDGNPANDDCRRTNNTARLTVDSLRQILARLP